MKKWNDVLIYWTVNHVLSLETDIPVTDWHDKKEKHFHTLCGLTARSLPKKRWANTKMIINRVSISPTDQRQKILQRIISVFVKDERKFIINKEICIWSCIGETPYCFTCFKC